MAAESAAPFAVVLAAVVATAPCLWYVYRGWQCRERYRLVRDARDVDSAGAVGTDRPVLLSGTARSTGDPATAPLSGDRVAFAAWSILEWQDETGHKVWSPEAQGLVSGGFAVESDGSTVAFPPREEGTTNDPAESLTGYESVTGIETEGVLVETAGFDTDEEVPQSEDPPDRFRRVEREVGLDDPDPGVNLLDLGRTHGTRRYREVAIEPGDEVTVLAALAVTGTRADGEESALELTRPEEGPILVSDLSPGDLTARYRWAYRKLFYGGLAIVLGGPAVATGVAAWVAVG